MKSTYKVTIWFNDQYRHQMVMRQEAENPEEALVKVKSRLIERLILRMEVDLEK